MFSRFLFSLALITSVAQAQVENFGEKGWFSNKTDVLDNVESFFGGENRCVEASKGEYQYVDDCVQRYDIVDPEKLKDFDPMIEELIFMEAARRTHQLSMCQVKLHEGIQKNPYKKSELLKNAFEQFTHVQKNSRSEINRLKDEESSLAAAKFAGIGFAEDRGTPNGYRIQKSIADGKEKVAAQTAKVNDIVASIPLGNRPQMRKKLIELLRSGKPVTETEFYSAYNKVLGELNEEVHQADRYMTSLQTPSFDRKGKIYSLNEDMKKSLVKSGQIENVLSLLQMAPRLQRSFMCRTKARYDTGPTTLRLIELPTYFLGGYGLGRLALRAGVGAIRATSAAAVNVARAQVWASNLAMIGLESYEWARVANDIREACIPQEFLVGSADDSCTEETEFSGMYQESLSASCITKSLLSVGPPLLVNGIRLSKGFRVVASTPAKVESKAETTVDEIIVTGIRPKKEPELTLTKNDLPPSTGLTKKYREARFDMDVKKFKTDYLKKNPKASESDALKKAQNAAVLKRQRAIELRKSCSSKSVSADQVKAAKIFSKYSLGYGMMTTAALWSYSNIEKAKDTRWFANLGFEVAMSFFMAKFNARMASSKDLSFRDKYVKGNINSFKFNLIESGVYGIFFPDDDEKAKNELERISKSPTFTEDVNALIEFTEKESKLNSAVDAISDTSANAFRIITGEEVVRDLTPEELSKLSKDRLKDPHVQEQLMDLVMDKMSYEEVDGITSGNNSLDRLTFNTVWNAGLTPVNILLGAATFQAVCWNIDSPGKALAAFSAIQVSRQGGMGFFYYRTRKEAIHQ